MKFEKKAANCDMLTATCFVFSSSLLEDETLEVPEALLLPRTRGPDLQRHLAGVSEESLFNLE